MHLTRTMQALLMFLLCTTCGAALFGQTLYCATGSNGVNSQLFTVNPTTGATTLVGSVLIGANPVSITGLAIHPTTGILYGVTANVSTNNPRSLVTINPASGAATLIGSLGANPAPDIAFNAAGTLFGWMAGIHDLATIDIVTGVATVVGNSGATGTSGGGLAINSTGVCFSSNSSDTGTLDTLNTGTGALTVGPTLTAAPQGGAINSMSFNGADILFAIDSDQGSVAAAVLVTINTTTGAVTTIGNLPNDSDALVWDNGGGGGSPEMNVSRGGNVADGGTDALGNRTFGQASTLTYTISNTGTATLNITTPVLVAGQTNCTASVTSQPANTVAAAGSTTLVISVTPTAAGAFSFTVSIGNDDSNENPYDWTASGTGTSGGGNGNGDGGDDDEGCSTGESSSALLLVCLAATLVLSIRLRRSRA